MLQCCSSSNPAQFFLIISFCLTALFLGFLVSSRPVEVCIIFSSASALNRRRMSSSRQIVGLEHPATFIVVVSSGIVGQCAIVAVPHRDWIEWVVEPVLFKVGDESCCGSILRQQRFKQITTLTIIVNKHESQTIGHRLHANRIS